MSIISVRYTSTKEAFGMRSEVMLTERSLMGLMFSKAYPPARYRLASCLTMLSPAGWRNRPHALAKLGLEIWQARRVFPALRAVQTARIAAVRAQRGAFLSSPRSVYTAVRRHYQAVRICSFQDLRQREAF